MSRCRDSKLSDVIYRVMPNRSNPLEDHTFFWKIDLWNDCEQLRRKKRGCIRMRYFDSFYRIPTSCTIFRTVTISIVWRNNNDKIIILRSNYFAICYKIGEVQSQNIMILSRVEERYHGISSSLNKYKSTKIILNFGIFPPFLKLVSKDVQFYWAYSEYLEISDKTDVTSWFFRLFITV